MPLRRIAFISSTGETGTTHWKRHGNDLYVKQRNSFWLGLRVMGRADLRENPAESRPIRSRIPGPSGILSDHLDNPNSVALVAERNGFILGYEVFESASRLQLYSCVVRRASRRHGIGSRLVEKLIAIVADRGADRIAAKIPERNLVASFPSVTGDFGPREFWSLTLDDQDVYVMEYTMPGRSISSVDAESGEDEVNPLLGSKTLLMLRNEILGVSSLTKEPAMLDLSREA